MSFIPSLRKIIAVCSLALLLLIIGVAAILSQQQPQQKVLGDNSFQIFIESDANQYGSNVIIGQSSLAPAVIYLSAYQTTGDASVRIYDATKSDLLQILTYKKDDRDQVNSLLDTDNRQKIYQQTVSLVEEGKAIRVNIPIDNKKGIWLIESEHKNQKRHALLIRSGFGVYSQATERDYLFWAQDYLTGQSVGNANLKLYNTQDTAKELSARSLNHQGILQQEMQPDVDIAIVEKDDDLALVPINLTQLNYGGTYKRFSKYNKEHNYFVFTDRPLYKPGDKVLYKAIVRDEIDRVYTPTSGNVRVKIYQGWDDAKPLFDRNLPLDTQGHLDGEFSLPQDTKTGYYTLSVTAGDQSGYLYQNQVSFNVEYYTKPEYSVQVTADQIEYIRGEQAKLKIKATYFSGEPVRDQMVEYAVRSGSFEQYFFYNNVSLEQQVAYRGDNIYGKVLLKSQTKLDDNGEAEIVIDTSGKENTGEDQIWSIAAELGSLGEATTSSYQNILVRNSEMQLISDQDYTWGGKVNTSQQINLALVPNKNLNQNITKYQNLTVSTELTQWEEYTEPNYKYPQYREIKQILPDKQLSSDQNGKLQHTFTPDKTGYYKFTFRLADAKGNVIQHQEHRYISATDYYESYLSYYRSYEFINVTQDKKTYQIGDSAALNIAIPQSRRNILMTVNGKFADRYQVLTLDSNNQSIPLQLQSNDIPNRIVKFVTFSTTDYHGTTKNLEVDPSGKKINLTITPDKTETAPNDTITVNVETKDNKGNPVAANVTLWSVDKALFELTASTLEDIFQRFWYQRYFRDTMAHSLEGIYINRAEGGGCFAADTPILMADGTTKPIKDLKVGHYVKTRKSQTDATLVNARVTKTFIHNVNGYMIVNGSLKVTPEHKVLLNGLWREIGYAQVGDTLIDKDNKQVAIESIEWYHQPITVHNFEVETYHTYFADNLYVHNQKGGADVRANLKDTGYWNPRIQTGADGRASVKVNLPDNLTTWVFSAVAANQQTQVGQTTTEVRVTKDVIVRPILPNVLFEGDRIKLSALVYNGLPSEQIFNTSFKLENALVETTAQTTRIPAEKTLQLFWDITAQNTNPLSKVTVQTVSQNDSSKRDGIRLPLPILPIESTQQIGQSGVNNHRFELTLPHDLNQEKSELSVVLSATLAGNTVSAMDYLIGYPYGCTEQTMSKLVPIIIAKKRPDLYGQSLQKYQQQLELMFAKGINRLQQNQRPDGGFAWWGTGEANPLVSAYVAQYLKEATNLGFDVNQEILTQIQSYFTNLKPKNNDEVIIQKHALSILSDTPASVYRVTYEQVSNDILARAVIVNLRSGQKNPQENGAKLLHERASVQGDRIYWKAGSLDNFSTDEGATALAIQALYAEGTYRQDAVKALNYLVRNKKTHYWANSLATAHVLTAVSEVEKQTTTKTTTYTVKTDAKNIKSGTISSLSSEPIEITIPVKDWQSSNTIVVEKEGGADLFSTMVFKQVRTGKELQAVSNGLSVTRKYISEKGENYSLAVGDKVTVELTLNGLRDTARYVVIEDTLPAGLVPINTAFKNERAMQMPSSYGISEAEREYTQNGIILSMYQVPSGQSTVRYQARVVAEGEFTAPPAFAQLMYQPELNATSTTSQVSVEAEARHLYDLPIIQQNTDVINVITNSSQKTAILIFFLVGAAAIAVAGIVTIKRRQRRNQQTDHDQNEHL